jgi:SAM-dependent methyltransferase
MINSRGNDGIGLKGTLRQIADHASHIKKGLREYEGGNIRMPEPIFIDSRRGALGVYREGLGLTDRRFWTTSYMRSEFWTRSDESIIKANGAMLARVRANNGTARRIFLLERPTLDEVNAWEHQLVFLRQQGKEDDMARLIRQLEHLTNSVNELKGEGFEVRVTCDRDQWRRLPERIQQMYTENDTELAIYNDFRVDLYGGGSLGYISHVYIFSEATEGFEGVLESALEYYTSLWTGAQLVEQFLEDMQKATARARRRLGYVTNYLAKFDADIDEDDKRLKREELETANELLAGHPMKLRSHLDIGTHTGRWLIEIRDRVEQSGRIIGIDNDEDCVQYAGARIREKTDGDSRIVVHQIDFVAPEIPHLGTFHLITCMLGTLSYFGLDKRPGFDGSHSCEYDTLQEALCRMASLLEKDGILLLSVWSPEACNDSGRRMLSIYRPTDRQLLANGTPEAEELAKRLANAGLCLDCQVSVDQRLTMYKCRLAE